MAKILATIFIITAIMSSHPGDQWNIVQMADATKFCDYTFKSECFTISWAVCSETCKALYEKNYMGFTCFPDKCSCHYYADQCEPNPPTRSNP
ncbi:OLC1v1000995C1 [Oldenlandia corymbosa var. corymbosa]|uniref:OLC1v1000995C1 n=1 Tax=Oldenlandia corymbosa var. corymbosa TaxID=529605 RepID=A0AAV1D739_OLDCO|nr:OLC1v1000995C1 [Oldenlandia corymbosa var. corymbosa]